MYPLATNFLKTNGTKQMHMLVLSEGTAITTAPQDQMALFNSTTFFYCQASVAKNTDMVFIWHFNGRPIDFYRDPEYRQVRLEYRNLGMEYR